MRMILRRVFVRRLTMTFLGRMVGVDYLSQSNDMADVSAKVTFDNNATDVPQLIVVATKAGYPADEAR